MKTEKELIKIIETAVKQYEDLQNVCEKALDCGMLDSDGVFYETIWKSFDAMLSLVDTDKWIDWYIFEAGCGEKNFEVIINDEKIIVDSPEKLAKVILA